MRKVIKIFLSAVSAAVLVLIVVPLFAALLLLMPPVQTAVVRQLATLASHRLGTTVSVERVNIRFPYRVRIEGFYVEDYAGDTLLYARQLSVSGSARNILKGDYSLGNVSLHGARFHLRETSDSTTNFSEVMSGIRPARERDREPRPVHLRVSSLGVAEGRFSYRAAGRTQAAGGVNLADLDITGILLDARGVAIAGDSIGARIKEFSFIDKSGFSLNTISARELSYTSRSFHAAELLVSAAGTEIRSGHVALAFPKGITSGDPGEIGVDIVLEDSRVAASSLAYFIPSLRGMDLAVDDISANFSGTVGDLRGSIGRLRMGGTLFAGSFAARGLPDIRKAQFDASVENFTSSVADIIEIFRRLTGKPMSENIAAVVTPAGNVALTGHFRGSVSQFEANAALITDLGPVQGSLTFTPEGGATSFEGRIESGGFDLGKMLSSANLGYISASAGLKGTLKQGKFSAMTDAGINELVYKNYNYHSVGMKGRLENNYFKGNITSSDPNLRFDFDGMLDFTDSIPRYDFDMKLFHADLRALHLNQRDSVSVVSGNMRAVAAGRMLDDMNGSVAIDDMLYVNHVDTVRTGQILITGDNSAGSKHLALRSSFADADFRSRTGYGELLGELRKSLRSYAPALAGAAEEKNNRAAKATAGSYSLLEFNVKEANNVMGIFLPGMMLARGTKLSFMFDSGNDNLAFSASSDYMEYGRNFLTNLDVNAMSRGDSLSLFLRADEAYASGLMMPRLSVIGTVNDDRLGLSARFNNETEGLSALIGATALVQRDTVTGSPRFNIRFTPSTFTSRGNTWTILGREIVIDKTGVSVQGLGLMGNNQMLALRGKASRSGADTLRLTLRNFDLGPFSPLVSGIGYTLQRGYTNGYADITSAISRPTLHAAITMDSVRINDVDVPSTLLESTWESDKRRARVTLSDAVTKKAILEGFYLPAEDRFLAEANLQNVQMSLIGPFVENILSDTKGSADAHLQISRRNKRVRVDGTINVRDFATRVEYLNVPYTIPKAVVAMRNNVLKMEPAAMFDPEGHRSEIDLEINLNNLKNVTYDINVRPVNTLVLNTTEADNELFYGRVYASGSAAIKGDKRAVNMDVTATTGDNSQFFMPLGGVGDMRAADFIVFRRPDVQTVDSTQYLERRRMIMQRRERRRREGSANLNINMVVNVQPNVDFQLLVDPRAGDMLRGRGFGSLTINVNPANDLFTMYGDYEITEGSYLFTLQNIISKQFAIEPGGVIKWTGEPADALLDVTAVYRLKASLAPLLDTSEASTEDASMYRNVPVECRLILGERLSNPNISFNVTIPNATPETQILVSNALNTQEAMATQFFYLLAANRFYSSGLGYGGIGDAVTSSIPLNFLTSQLSNLISNDRFNVGIQYRQRTELSSDEVNVDFSTNLFSNRVLVEIEGNYDTGNNPTVTNVNNRASTGNLTGDFAVTWLIDRSGNLRAKGFTRTIDRFDENQGLQESGIGIYYKENFNTVKDIVRNFRERFSGKRRRKAAQAKEAAGAGTAAPVRDEDGPTIVPAAP